ncbi:hypothetical protein BJY01DRAFT_242206 [Aspergillus pseudoustus]|uniref:Uncharacterized protein n=1 Tax=Aspergillus pseudoustus TaxID=1810923 RepID=A0ABR4L2S3_9EURO
MSTPEYHDDSLSDESEIEDVLDITLRFLRCLQSGGDVAGLAFRRLRTADVSPESISALAIPFPSGDDQPEVVDIAFESAASRATALNPHTRPEPSVEEGGSRRRPRLPPVRPPRPPAEIRSWDELFGGRHETLERERRAAEIASPHHLDIEPDQTTWPTNWDTHHDYFLWSCRGSVQVITDHLQGIFAFDPPIEETFVAARLGGVNAYKQLTFLRKYLPGETHSQQLAEARGVLYEADISNPDIRWGTQKLEIKQWNPGDFEYRDPVVPCWAPPNWTRADDAFAAMYIGDHPSKFQREYGWVFSDTPSLEFIRIRMAQIPHLNLSWGELKAAKLHREILVNRFPGSYPDDVTPQLPEFI